LLVKLIGYDYICLVIDSFAGHLFKE